MESSAKASSQFGWDTHLKPADADGQRELARVCLKIDDKEGARFATELADALGAARKP
jgi:hypothetical protein